MGLQQSKDELLYEQVSYGNVEGIKSLRSQGAGLETLIELGANVNGYRPGRHAGTPLHHAAKRGLVDTVNLLLSRGANALIMNDDCQSPLDVARAKGHSNVVRAIERHILLILWWWLREVLVFMVLDFWKYLLLSWFQEEKCIGVVVLPCSSRKPTKPYKLELAIYSSIQDAQPRTVIGLWKVNLEEPKSHRSDPLVIIHENSSKTHIKLASADENDKQQLKWFSDACKGIPQARPAFLGNNQPPVNPATAPPAAEDLELAMALSASIQSATQERPPFLDGHPTYESSASSSSSGNFNGWSTSTNTSSYNGWVAPIAAASPKVSSSDWSGVQTGPVGGSTGHPEIQDSPTQTTPSSDSIPSASTQLVAIPSTSTQSTPIPSAPPVLDASLDEYPIHYPSIDSSPIDLSNPAAESTPPTDDAKKGEGASSSCVICLDAPVEGACIPCGHMAGCMSCLSEIKGKKWGCPVCRAKIDQVVRLYAV
ncbi:hypothetical protein M0R45_018441 [Rubus argutus]|uniref:RING-type domain-containing protein n=1 Tax=Rubus argutus TaxID=59490 RepID=A0AAW1X2P4_RUBAR